MQDSNNWGGCNYVGMRREGAWQIFPFSSATVVNIKFLRNRICYLEKQIKPYQYRNLDQKCIFEFKTIPTVYCFICVQSISIVCHFIFKFIFNSIYVYCFFISFPPVSFPFSIKYILFDNIDSKVYYVTARVKKSQVSCC